MPPTPALPAAVEVQVLPVPEPEPEVEQLPTAIEMHVITAEPGPYPIPSLTFVGEHINTKPLTLADVLPENRLDVMLEPDES